MTEVKSDMLSKRENAKQEMEFVLQKAFGALDVSHLHGEHQYFLDHNAAYSNFYLQNAAERSRVDAYAASMMKIADGISIKILDDVLNRTDNADLNWVDFCVDTYVELIKSTGKRFLAVVGHQESLHSLVNKPEDMFAKRVLDNLSRNFYDILCAAVKRMDKNDAANDKLVEEFYEKHYFL